MRKVFLWWMLLFLALTACEQASILTKGEPAPAFSLADLTGSQRIFPDQFRQQPVVIRFWADWCASCRSEMKVLEQQYQQRKGQGLTILAVNVGQDQATAQRFLQDLGVTFDALLDEKSAVARRYGVIALPTTYLVARDGRIQAKIVGETDAATLSRLLDTLMAERP